MGRLLLAQPEVTCPGGAAVACEECGVELASDSSDLRLELTSDDEPVFYCETCWQREFGGELA
jgi:hypothetical protein